MKQVVNFIDNVGDGIDILEMCKAIKKCVAVNILITDKAKYIRDIAEDFILEIIGAQRLRKRGRRRRHCRPPGRRRFRVTILITGIKLI